MVKYVADGESFFSPKSAAAHRDFGFHGSLETGPRARMKPHTRGLPARKPAPMQDAMEPDADDMPMARGGSSGSGMLIHPMGHSVTHVTSGPSCMIQHHAHGGCTVVHDDGRVEHQRPGMAEGGEARAFWQKEGPLAAAVNRVMERRSDDITDATRDSILARGQSLSPEQSKRYRAASYASASAQENLNDAMGKKRSYGERLTDPEDAGRYPGFAEGGDVSDDDTDLNLARGGAMKAMRRVLGARTRLPPNQRPPKNPTVTPTPTNDMPGGQMGYGVQPSDEAGMMGGPGESAVPMRKGGKKR